jgi:hypothetical protein
MQIRKNQIRQSMRQRIRSGEQIWRFRYGWIFACLVALAAVACSARCTAQSATPPVNLPPRGEDAPGPGEMYPPVETAPPDKNAQLRMHEENMNIKQMDYTAANAERKKQIAEDSAKLLKLATDLKAEVEKTNKDTLSLTVIRKADEIERLAHAVKEKMKLTVGGGS